MIQQAAKDFAAAELLPEWLSVMNIQNSPTEQVKMMAEFMGMMVDPKWWVRFR
jgi:hypothetical protein